MANSCTLARHLADVKLELSFVVAFNNYGFELIEILATLGL